MIASQTHHEERLEDLFASAETWAQSQGIFLREEDYHGAYRASMENRDDDGKIIPFVAEHVRRYVANKLNLNVRQEALC